jgi:tetratricopeptide (TPR) repeat protein
MRKLLILLVGVVLASCQATENNLQTAIEGMEMEVQKAEKMDTTLAQDLTAAYLDFVDRNPYDSLSPYYMLKAADIYKEMPGKSLKAINVYNQLSRFYPTTPVAARAHFMVAYVFDEKLNDSIRAVKSYENFLDKYPDHPLADDARNLLAMRTDSLSQEDMVKEWLKQQDSN